MELSIRGIPEFNCQVHSGAVSRQNCVRQWGIPRDIAWFNADRSTLAQTGLGAIQTVGANVVGTGDALRNLYGRATWRFVGPRSRANIRLETRQERYITGSSISRNVHSVLAGVSRDFSQRLTLATDLRYSERDAETVTIVVKDSAAALTGIYRVTPRIGLSLSFEYANRDDNAGGGDYSDRRAWLGLSYSPIAQ
ncbi:MAG: outer membrane beta-barrel protein [Proteobacteria bacterium]|nr:outer membrane beta-barrel protein [Pseudomonadota bacterium]